MTVDGPSVECSLTGVALRTHDESYPFDYEPYAHQRRMADLVCDDEGFVAVNDSPTGGGKTASWLAPALTERLDTVAIYPTNALVVDQRAGIADELDAVDHEVSLLTLTSEELAKRRSEYGVSENGEVVERWYRAERRTSDQMILLTNPDIFVMMCRDMYRNPSREYANVAFAVVDEFHRAGRKEQNTLRYLLDELYERPDRQSRLDRIAFLSATPDAAQERQFERGMAAPYHRVTESSGDGVDTQPDRRAFTDSPADGWRSVMPPVDLDVRTAPTFGTADVLLEDDADDLRSFCAPAADAGEAVAVILDGVHEVKRVWEFLDAELDCRVERVDGFHSDRKASKLREFDVLVSNSAVEVGIDFDIDRLLFAAHDRGSFLQRLGRLRTSRRQSPARCYVPRSVAQSLATDDRITTANAVTRETLDAVLDDAYPSPREPHSFDWRYSAPEALEHLSERRDKAPSDRQEAITSRGRARIERQFLADADARVSREDIYRTTSEMDWRVLRALQWYRGDSVQALVYDRTTETVRSYDVFYLLRYGQVTFHDQATFEQLIPDSGQATFDRLKRYVDGFCTYDGTIQPTEEGWGRSVAFTGPSIAELLDTGTVNSDRRPRVLKKPKLSVTPSDGQPRVRTLDRLNDRLQRRRDRLGKEAGLLCYPLSIPATVARESYNLGKFFFLYPVALEGQEACLALGTDALYLHSLVMEDAERDDGDGLIGGVTRRE